MTQHIQYWWQPLEGCQALVAMSESKIAFLGLASEPCEFVETEMKSQLKGSTFKSSSGAQLCLAELMSRDLLLSGTPFQQKVWHFLTQLPKGTCVSYQDVAQRLGMPKSVRAVANAIGRNPISLLVPCHRVIAKSGKLQGYRWGLDIKELLLKQEGSYGA